VGKHNKEGGSSRGRDASQGAAEAGDGAEEDEDYLDLGEAAQHHYVG
jgi:hypothetical protein